VTAEYIAAGTHIDTIEIAALRRQMQGALLEPGNASYDQARRIANGAYDRNPALIARCATAEDVARAVVFAREHGLEIAVRSGGHSIPGHSSGDGVMMIDLAGMKGIDLAADRRSARVQPGVTNGELVLALGAQGLATTTGTCATVGMGGSTLGGGIGWLMGRFGATIDNVQAFEVVSADGEILTATPIQRPDLFWALCGGGGNFGVVTNITYKVHELGQVLGGVLVFPLAAAPLALRMYRHLTSTAPDELMAHAVIATLPDFGPALVVQAVYSGEDLAEGERLLAPMRAFGPPAIDAIAPRSYAETYMMLTPPIPPGVPSADSAYSLREPSDAALDELVAIASARPSPGCAINIHQFHGAAARVEPSATAFALREEHYSIVNIGMWMQGDGTAERLWAQQAQARMAPHASSGVYVNFLGNEGEDAIRASYRANYERLARIKAYYDPDNIFRRNQNIKPTDR
jgi:FAD/FMN-containing dehydrogenase